MPIPLLLIIGVLLVGIVIASLMSGKVMAGSRGWSANYYSRTDNPRLFYLFVGLYSFIAALIFNHII